MRSLGFQRLAAFSLPRASLQRPEATDSIALSLQAVGPTSTLNINEVRLNAGNEVRIGTNPSEANRYDLVIIGENLTLNVSVRGAVRLIVRGLDDIIDEQRDYTVGGLVKLVPALNRDELEELSLSFTVDDFQDTVVAPQLAIADIHLSKVIDLSDTQRSLVRRVSTVESGSLFLEELDGKEIELRPGEALRFSSTNGIIRRIQLEDEYLTLQFRGSVTGMKTGSQSNPRNLMPTYLERLLANNSLIALLGGTVAFLTLFFLAFDWWRGLNHV